MKDEQSEAQGSAMSTAPLQQQLARLRESFAARIPERVAEVSDAWQSTLKADRNIEGLRRAHRLAHSLAGSAATFGYSRLSESARQFEFSLQALIEGGTNLTESRIAEARDRLALLKETAAISAQGPEIQEQAVEFLKERREQRNLVWLIGSGASLRELAGQIGYFGYDARQACTAMELAGDAVAPAAIIVDKDSLKDEGELAVLTQGQCCAPKTPVLFVSAQSDYTSRLRAMRAGVEAYFTKPLNLSQLIDKLDMLTTRLMADPYRILIVEDDNELADYYALTLESVGMSARVIQDPSLVLPLLLEWNPDLILMDLYLDDCTGLELAAVIRQQQDYLSIPIVYLSAETRREKQLAAMSRGADDFLTKPIDPEHLIASISSRAERSHALRALIVRDGLTGLLNHTAIKVQLETELGRARKSRLPLAYAMLDIDRFKSVNDTYGHPTGDSVIKTLARLLRQRLRQTDLIGRYGGEEFAVILPGATAASAYRVLDEVRDKFAQIHHQSGGAELSVTFSAGIALYPPLESASLLNDEADRALYRAKQNGRNLVQAALD